jgi:undecaprenyl-diphosphatase
VTAPNTTTSPARPNTRAGRFRLIAALGAQLRQRRALVALVLLLVTFVALAHRVRSPEIRAWDAGVSREFQEADTPALTAVAIALTAAGGGAGLAVCAVPAAVWLVRTRRPKALTLLLLTISGHLINAALKVPFSRPRPGPEDLVEVLYRSAGTSFPSGHAQTATMFFGFWAFLVAVHVSRRGLRHALIAVLVTAALAICWSRVYLGGHFVSDIAGGIAAGLFFLLLWAAAYRWMAAGELVPALPSSPAR